MWDRVMVTYQAHNLKIGGSIPPPATNNKEAKYQCRSQRNLIDIGAIGSRRIHLPAAVGKMQQL